MKAFFAAMPLAFVIVGCSGPVSDTTDANSVIVSPSTANAATDNSVSPTSAANAPTGIPAAPPAATTNASPPLLDGKPVPKSVTKLIIRDTKKGTGTAAKSGDTVNMNYTGMLTDGTVFDTSYGRAPFSFTLGGGQVIKGWDEGIVGMKPGGKRLLVIPSDMGYGPTGSPPKIPGDATLVFEVEMLPAK